MSIYVVDSMMGTGKTMAAIHYINTSPPETKFLYITPFLSEVNRIKESCPGRRFVDPQPLVTKFENIKSLLKEGKNVVSTHALFSKLDNEVVELVRKHSYVLILDEVIDVIHDLDIGSSDARLILNNLATVEPNGIVRWNDPTYKGTLSKYKRLCDAKQMVAYRDTILLWIFPSQLFRAFKDVFVLTYMFEAQLQRCYFDLFGISYQYLSVEGSGYQDYCFSTGKGNTKFAALRQLIHICDNIKLNDIGKERYSLSAHWYQRHRQDESKERLRKNLSNYFRNIIGAKSNQALWTTYKGEEPFLSGKGYKKGFLVCNARATNEYREKNVVGYMINLYPSPIFKNFFVSRNIELDEDKYALSELVQFIWRSAIRDNKEIWVYLPSKRMRTLFVNWIDEITKEDL